MKSNYLSLIVKLWRAPCFSRFLRLLLLVAEVPDIDTTIGHRHQNNERLGGHHQSLSLACPSSAFFKCLNLLVGTSLPFAEIPRGLILSTSDGVSRKKAAAEGTLGAAMLMLRKDPQKSASGQNRALENA